MLLHAARRAARWQALRAVIRAGPVLALARGEAAADEGQRRWLLVS
jgi:hypothetical protein